MNPYGSSRPAQKAAARQNDQTEKQKQGNAAPLYAGQYNGTEDDPIFEKCAALGAQVEVIEFAGFRLVKISGQMQDICRRIIFRNRPCMSFHLPDQMQIYPLCDAVDRLFPDCVVGDSDTEAGVLLDLSELANRGVVFPMTSPQGHTFFTGVENWYILAAVLMLAGMRCNETGAEITALSFDDNRVQTDWYHVIEYLAMAFPRLKRASFSNCSLPKLQTELLRRRNLDLEIFEHPQLRLRRQQFMPQVKPVDHPGNRPMVPMPPKPVTSLVPRNPLEAYVFGDVAPGVTFGDAREMFLSEVSGPVQAFALEFFKRYRKVSFCSEESHKLDRYYCDISVFSVTVDTCGPNSPLEVYQQLSRNMMKEEGPRAVGVEEIRLMYRELFGDSLLAKVSSMQICDLHGGIVFAVVMHGCFLNPIEDVFDFDRTMIVHFTPVPSQDKPKATITNDHMFIRRHV